MKSVLTSLRIVIEELCKLLLGSIVVTGVLAAILHLLSIQDSALYVFTCLLIICLLSIIYAIIEACYSRDIRRAVITAMAIASLSGGFFVTLPIAIERSASVFLMSKMAQQPEYGFSSQELENDLTIDYIKGRNAVGKRMHEQIMMGNIVQDSRRHFSITKRGMIVARLLRMIGEFYAIPHQKTSVLYDK